MMNSVAIKFMQRHLTRFCAVAIALTLYGFARLPDSSDAERALLATRFHFTSSILPDLPGYPSRNVRPVNPSLEHISA